MRYEDGAVRLWIVALMNSTKSFHVKTSKLAALRCTTCGKTLKEHLNNEFIHIFVIERQPEYHLYSQKSTKAYGESAAVCGRVTSDLNVRIVRNSKKVACQSCRSGR